MKGPGRAARRLFQSLGDRNYRLFFVGQGVSLTGTWMQRVGQDWLILQLTDSAFALSVGVALQFLPLLLFGLWGGLLVDRFDTRRLLVWTQSLSGVLALTLGVLSLTGIVQLWMVYALAFALGCVTVVDQPARQGFVTELVGPEGVANAVSLNSSTNQAARLIGPAIAGLVIAAVGVPPAFLVNAVSYLAVIAGLCAMDPTALRAEQPVPRARGQLREGLRYTARTPELRAPLALVMVVSLLTQNYRVVLPLLATDVFAGGPGAYGGLTATLGAGALIGGLLCAYFARPSQRLVLAIALFFGIATLIAAAAPTLVLLGLLLVPVGIGNTSFNATANALIQLRSASAFRGRVLAVRSLAFQGMTPIGAPLVGLLCARYGPRVGLAVGGIAAVLAAAIAFPTRRLDHESDPEQPQRRPGGIPMRAVPLGTDGPQVSVLAYGAMSLSQHPAGGRPDDANSLRVLERALESGVTLLDTADKYGSGHNERLVGRALRGRREGVVVATKFGMVRHPDGRRENIGRPDYVHAACERSLRRLGVEVIDLYYQHRVDPETPVEETVGAMSELVAAGKVRFLGLSEAGPDTIRRAHATHPITALQSEYSLWSRDVEDEILPLCRELGIGFVAYSPLGIGFLTGTVDGPYDLPPGNRLAHGPRMSPENLPSNRRLAERLADIARPLGVTPGQLALAWLLQRGVVPIPGTRSVAHLEENLAAAQLRLPEDVLGQLDRTFPRGAAAGARKPPQGLAMTGL